MPNGTIITFYSYKGGVGRTFALANIAVLLARWGSRVLCVDWDLEAPGLHIYFATEPQHGLLDVINDVVSRKFAWHDFVMTLPRTDTAGRLNFWAAGRQDAHYVPDVQQLAWGRLYAEHDLGAYFERLRREWIEEYDLVLIDSRTGITDIGAICTAQMPDVLVNVFTANEQGVSGAIDVSLRAQAARQRLPYERTKLITVPVPSRFDAREEYDLAEQWKAQFVKRFESFYRPWLHEGVKANRAIDLCTIPYISKWSFGERLAVDTETRRSPDFATYTLENIAALLALKFSQTSLFGESPDSYVRLAKREAERTEFSRESGQASRRFRYDVFISSGGGLREYATSLNSELRQRGLSTCLPDDLELPTGETVQEALNRGLSSSRHCLLLIGDRVSEWQTVEAETFLKQILEEKSERRLIPILLGKSNPRELAPFLAHIQFMDARGQDVATVADQLIKIFNAIR